MSQDKIFIFKRPCIRCDKMFLKTGKAQKICEDCSLQRLTRADRKKKEVKK